MKPRLFHRKPFSTSEEHLRSTQTTIFNYLALNNVSNWKTKMILDAISAEDNVVTSRAV